MPTTQMPIFVLFVSAGVLFDGAFSLRVSLTTNKFSTDTVRPLSKRNRFSIGRCAKFVRPCVTICTF